MAKEPQSYSGTAGGQAFASSLSSSSNKALQDLIAQLSGGGTAQQRALQLERLREISTNQGIRGEYSKGKAFEDASGLMAVEQRKALEESLPMLVNAAEGAGTSKNALRALLITEQATRAAERSSALGAQQAVAYGQIQGNISGTLEALTRPNFEAERLLLGAMDVQRQSITPFIWGGQGSNRDSTAGNTGAAVAGSMEPFAFSNFKKEDTLSLDYQMRQARLSNAQGGGGSGSTQAAPAITSGAARLPDFSSFAPTSASSEAYARIASGIGANRISGSDLYGMSRSF